MADVVHVLASGMWVGALLDLVLLVTRPASRVGAAHLGLTHRALHGFGLVGTAIVGTVVLTGLINAWLLVGTDHDALLGTTLYGQFLIARLARLPACSRSRRSTVFG